MVAGAVLGWKGTSHERSRLTRPSRRPPRGRRPGRGHHNDAIDGPACLAGIDQGRRRDLQARIAADPPDHALPVGRGVVRAPRRDRRRRDDPAPVRYGPGERYPQVDGGGRHGRRRDQRRQLCVEGAAGQAARELRGGYLGQPEREGSAVAAPREQGDHLDAGGAGDGHDPGNGDSPGGAGSGQQPDRHSVPEPADAQRHQVDQLQAHHQRRARGQVAQRRTHDGAGGAGRAPSGPDQGGGRQLQRPRRS
ncbi:MAG: hypothetical protein GIKADHBN_03455 [Phycisphaerales bacterium]|nr:hypothetical protein [Phycisphaerales bacterium]